MTHDHNEKRKKKKDRENSKQMDKQNENEILCKNEVYPLQHVKNSWYEKATDLVVVVIYIRFIQKETLNVEFKEKSVKVQFQARDSKFLDLYPQCSDKTFFCWTITLKDSIIPDKCQYNLSQTVLNLNLIKTESKRWGVLEAPQEETQIVAVPSNTWLPASPATKETSEDEESSGMKGDGDMSEVFSADTRSQTVAETKPTCMVSPLNKLKQEQVTPRGLTGLDNLGNTCFMNSVLQCLVNTQEFHQYFLGNYYQPEINTENPLGTGGKLAVSFATLMRTLWSGSHKSFSPSKLKNLISLKANQFTGFLQHDAQEFMAFLLDGLHEDLNRIKSKPYTQNSLDGESRLDDVLANEAWQLYKKRNDSIIVDLFQGQYKSKLVCPVCSKVSITFDPFLYLSVPLPKKQRTYPIIFFAKDPSKRPVKYYLRLSQNAIANELFNELSKLTTVPASCLRIFEVARNKISRFISRGINLELLTENTPIYAFEVLNKNLIGEPVVEYTILQRVKMPLPVTRCSYCKHEAPPDTKLKRCTNCYRVGYCDQTCQRNHWSNHKTNCKLQAELIGIPFIISMPRSQATYSKLCYMVEAYSRYSVDVFQPPIKLKEPLGCKSASTNENIPYGRANSECSSTITSASASTTESQKINSDIDDNDNKNKDEENNDNEIQTMSSTRAVVGQMKDKLGERLAQPFTICCVNQSGQSVCDGDKVEDTGDDPLDLPSKFLAVDWNNNEKMKNFVLVQSKPLEAEMDEDDCISTRDAYANITLEQCLQLFTEPEELTPDEAWYCPNCKEHREATKTMSLWRLPTILIIQLKRFSFKNLILRDKIDKTVEFPIRHLDLTPYHCGVSESDNLPPIYDLYAVINHHGTILGGHYTAFARLVSQSNTRRSEVDWRLFDDSRVSFVDENRVMTTAGYVLFYRRRGTAFQLPVRCDEAISTAPEENEDQVEKSPLKLESGDFERSLIVAPFSDMEAVD